MPRRSPNPSITLGVRVSRELLVELDALAESGASGKRKVRRSDVARAALERGLRLLAAEGWEATEAEVSSPVRGGPP